jgi:hypothetical protein
MQDEMQDLMESANEVQEALGRNYAADDINDEDLEAGTCISLFSWLKKKELDALGDELLFEAEEAPSYLQEPELDYLLPAASSSAVPAVQVPGGVVPKQMMMQEEKI